MKNIYITITIFCIAVSSSFWMGQYAGRENLIQCQSELLQARAELKVRLGVEVARRVQVEWLKQREDAFEEIIKIEMLEMKK